MKALEHLLVPSITIFAPGGIILPARPWPVGLNAGEPRPSDFAAFESRILAFHDGDIREECRQVCWRANFRLAGHGVEAGGVAGGGAPIQETSRWPG